MRLHPARAFLGDSSQTDPTDKWVGLGTFKIEADTGLIKFWSGGGYIAVPDYREDTVELGGDFTAGETVKCVRIGNQVTISSDSLLSHSSNDSPSSAFGAIPEAYRPSSNTTNVYRMSSSGLFVVGFNTFSGGLLFTNYRDFSGAGLSQTSTGTGFALTFIT